MDGRNASFGRRWGHRGFNFTLVKSKSYLLIFTYYVSLFLINIFYRYSKLEFQQARSLWMAGMRHLGDVEATEADYETQFSVMVEQEVERRLFQVSLYYCYCVELIDEVRIWAEFCSYCESNSGQKKKPDNHLGFSRNEIRFFMLTLCAKNRWLLNSYHKTADFRQYWLYM